MEHIYDFESLMKKHYNEVFHYIRKQTNDLEEAKDLSQDTFIKVSEKLHSFNAHKDSIKTWIFRISQNHIMNYFKNKYNEYQVNLQDEHIHQLLNKSDDLLETLIQYKDIRYAICMINKNLNSKQHKIMNLYFFSDLTINELAITLKSPENDIYETINISLKLLRDKIEAQFNG